MALCVMLCVLAPFTQNWNLKVLRRPSFCVAICNLETVEKWTELIEVIQKVNFAMSGGRKRQPANMP
jgi:hypothetical protein